MRATRRSRGAPWWFEANAERLERASGRAASARCRALLAAAWRSAGAPEPERGSLHDRSPIPFDRARTLLALGVARRRANERRGENDARGGTRRLPVARRHALGAARRRGAGANRRRPVRERAPVEQRVVELVAAGSTNRAVAAALFQHCERSRATSRVYGKLGAFADRNSYASLREDQSKVT